MSAYRNSELLRLARLAPKCFCCMRLNDGSVVASHSNAARDGKGMGLKAHDFRIAFICTIPCHQEIDQGKRPGVERTEMWERAHRATIGWLFESGWLVLAPLSLNDVPIDYDRPASSAKPKRKISKGRPIQNRGFPAGKRPFR